MIKVTGIIAMIIILSSCQKIAESNMIDPDLSQETYSRMATNGDTIYQLDSTKFPKREEAVVNHQRIKIDQDVPFSSYNMDEWSTLYQLNGIPFYIQTVNSSLGNTTLTNHGQGNEITIEPFAEGSANQLFYFQFLPASSGIPLLIRSHQEGTPIGAGSYSSDPDRYVLFTHGPSNSLFGASWDLKFNNTKSAYFIQNQDLLGQGPGGMWDIYNYVLQATQGTINFGRRNESIGQQFTIVPVGRYHIGAIEFDYENGFITGTSQALLISGETPNYSYTDPDNTTLTLQQSTSNTTSFRETSGITRTSSGGANVSFSIPGILTIGGSVTITDGTSTSNEYSESSTHTIAFTETYNFPTPPRTTLVYEWKVTKYEMSVPYRARCVSEDGTTFFYVSGTYEGVHSTGTYLERQFVSMDNPSEVTVASTLINDTNS